MKKLDTSIQSHQSNSGQALMALLVFLMLGLTVSTTAVSLTVSNSINAQKFQDSQVALAVAESGAENAIIRLLRDPNYSGETLLVGTDTAVITVTSGSPTTIVSVGRSGNFERSIAVQLDASSGILSIVSWKETY